MNNFIKDHLIEINKRNFSNPELELRVLLSHCSINNNVVFLNNFTKEDKLYYILLYLLYRTKDRFQKKHFNHDNIKLIETIRVFKGIMIGGWQLIKNYLCF